MKIQSLGLEAGNLLTQQAPRAEPTPPKASVSPPPIHDSASAGNGEKTEDLKTATYKAVEKISNFVNFNSADLQFTVDEDTDTPIVKVVDRNTKEVIRQIPSQEAIEISKALDKLVGLLIKNQA